MTPRVNVAFAVWMWLMRMASDVTRARAKFITLAKWYMNYNVYKTLQKIICHSFWVCGQCPARLSCCIWQNKRRTSWYENLRKQIIFRTERTQKI